MKLTSLNPSLPFFTTLKPSLGRYAQNYKKIESENYKKNRTGTAMLPVKWESLREKSVKNLKENLTKIINKQVLLSKSLICIKIRSIRVQEENIISVRFERSV